MKLVNPADILGGKTFSYNEVFGVKDGVALGTEINDVHFYIYDRYCMNPRCKCDDVVLHYVENDEREDHKGADFAILLSLINKKFEVLDAHGVSKKRVQEMVKSSLKDSSEAIELFKKRYKEMKTAGREAIQDGKEKSKAVDEPLQVKAERNSPCPCGSGKKYKKCCGAS